MDYWTTIQIDGAWLTEFARHHGWSMLIYNLRGLLWSYGWQYAAEYFERA